MKILVAGGFGFVGARVAQALDRAGHEVVLGSRSPRPAPDWLPQAQVRAMDWRSGAQLKDVCLGVDAVIHASGMNAAACAANPAEALAVNGVGTAELVQAAIAADVQRFFYFSTAHVYASPLQGDINEACCPRNLHPYASSHLAGEYALLHTVATKRIAGSSLRLSNGFGAPLSPDTDCWTLLTNDLCRQAVTLGKLTLQSSGDQRRDFVPLSAICADILALLMLPGAALPPILNIGSGASLSVMEMARLIQSRCEASLGFAPSIEAGQRKENALPLRYGSLHAQRLPLESPDPIAEIDALLAYCKAHFKA